MPNRGDFDPRSCRKPHDILAALGQAVFVWDIASDAIAWGEQVAQPSSPAFPPERLATGAEFAKLIEPARSLADRGAGANLAGARRRRHALPGRIRRAHERRPIAGDLDRGDRPLVRRAPTAARCARSALSASTTSATPATRS